MLFWILIILAIVSFVLLRDSDLDLCFLGAGFAVFGIIVSFLVLGANQIPREAYVRAMEQRYISLTYQLENNLYDNDNDLGKKELYAEVQDWNEDLASNRELQRSFWVGIYIPNIYDQFDFIEYK